MKTEIQKVQIQELAWVDGLTELLDSKFRIPGTNIRFGADFMVGLIPYAGDMISFGISGILVLAMARHGVSTWILLRMLWNLFLDTTIGAIPILGDIFDLGYRANTRNLNLLREHYDAGGEKGSAWKAILMVLLMLFVMFLLMIYLIWNLIAWGVGMVWS